MVRNYDLLNRVRNGFGKIIIIPTLAALASLYACGGDSLTDIPTGDVTGGNNGNGNTITLPGKNYNVANTKVSYEKAGNEIVFRFIHPVTNNIVEARGVDLPFDNVKSFRNIGDLNDNGQVGETDIPLAKSLDDLVALEKNWAAVENKSPNGSILNGYRNPGDVYVEIPKQMLDNADRYTVAVGSQKINVSRADLIDDKFVYIPTGKKEGSLEVQVNSIDKNNQKITYVTEADLANLPKVYAGGEVIDKKIMDINIPKNGDRVYLLVETDDSENPSYSTKVNGTASQQGGSDDLLLRDGKKRLYAIDITDQVVGGMNKIGIAEYSGNVKVYSFRITNSKEFQKN